VTLLSVERLKVSALHDGRSIEVIGDVSFRIAPGQVLAFVGESGAGKSIITKAIARLLPPNFRVASGRISFGGADLVTMRAPDRRRLLGRDIAFIPQEPMSALDPIMTIGAQFDEHLARIDKKPRSERRALAAALMESVRLPRPRALLSSYPHELSGGMCQRVLIAMAFASRPRLIVADEPTTALDVTIQARIMRLMAELRRRDGTAMLFVTHDLRLAAQIADEILVLYAGRIAERGPATEVSANPRHPYTRSLLLANPPVTGPDRGLLVMPDRMPGISALADLAGCAFAPRCAVATADCAITLPPVVEVDKVRAAACLYPARTASIVSGPALPRSSPTVKSPVLIVDQLSKTFARKHGLFSAATRVDALQAVSFQLAANEFLGVVGESGSGKSTLARLLVGLEQPTSGRIVLDGVDVTNGRPEAHRHRVRSIQMVFQNPQSALNPRRLVWQLVVQVLEAVEPGLTNPQRVERAHTMLREMGLPNEAAHRYPGQLSGGQRQRINIARALCVLPKVLVADEIVSGLDVSVQAQLLELLLRLRDEHAFSMILISHDLSVVRHLCDRIAVMRNGSVVEMGTTSRVLGDPQHTYTRGLLDAVPPDDPSERWAALRTSETAD
jgi:peptide/nickel transport system ATP-binding protein